MRSKDVRQSFLDFFKSKDHTIVSSAPVIPAKDPTLLFTNAGMNQFKDVFLGAGKREYTRVADSQKCIRVSGKHNDLEEVGVDTTHHTFFEMLGNWSFGDYYKKEAIEWAWELFTEVWKLDKRRLFATVFLDDDEAEELWCNVTDIGAGRVSRLGKEENFWEMGETGPCGPCSEIHYDLRDDISEEKSLHDLEAAGESVELWNLVFIQFNRLQDQSLVELPKKHVDTGMGFERVTAILQNKKSNYDSDIFTPTIEVIGEITGKDYIEQSREGVAFRVLSDHIRALVFAVADGALPSNDGRGYVLRRILRRAARFGRELDMHEPFIYRLVSPVVDTLGDHYPEIKEQADYISMIIKSEEESFGNTLDRGIELFNKVAENAKKSGSAVIPGEEAFRLYDTYGFPLDLTELMGRECGLILDEDGFNREMTAQKKRSYIKKNIPAPDGVKGVEITTRFSYNVEKLDAGIAAIYDRNGNAVKEVTEGDIIDIQLHGSTPFYAESGGQVGDTGFFRTDGDKSVVKILDTQKTADNAVFHHGKVIRGTISVGDTVHAEIDAERRMNIKRNHTATHLLHEALRKILGTHVRQAGSLVGPDYLRFDFNHFKKIPPEEIAQVEERVNDAIRRNYSVTPEEEVPFEEAKKMGAMALFGEKYGDRVRVVEVDNYSYELCGGTHVNATGTIGNFRIVSESAAAAGVRRIVAETGEAASRRIAVEREEHARVKELLNAADGELVEKIQRLLEEKKNLEKELREYRTQSSKTELDRLINTARASGRTPLFAHRFSVSSADELKEIGDEIRGKMPEGAALLGASIDDKGVLVCVVGDTLISEKNWKAGVLVKKVAKSVGGGGGGRPHMATAGVKDSSQLDKAMSIFSDAAQSLYGNN
ncbi:alanine--tRNA ligase [candidate division KSB1 bacterium]